MLTKCVLYYFLSKMYSDKWNILRHNSMMIAAIGIAMLIHLIQYVPVWWGGGGGGGLSTIGNKLQKTSRLHL